MRRVLAWCSLGLSLSCLVLSAANASAATAAWEVLTDCRLGPNRANDGDSFHVLHNNREYIFRLYFVDAPETDNSVPERVAEQAAYFGISKESALSIGESAKQFSAAKLSWPFTVITRWEDAKGRSRLPRAYAFVRVNGRDLGEDLVENGLARIYGARARLPDGTTAANEKAKLRSLEHQAKAAHRGAWAYSTNIPNEPQRPQSTALPPNPTSAAVKKNQPRAATINRASDTQTTQYRLAASGIRHNSHCRFFNGSTTRPCGPNDGRPCKICGG